MVRLLRNRSRLILVGGSLILLGGCSPNSPTETGEIPAGETTDSFSITVTWWNEVVQMGGFPLMDAIVFVEFIDIDNLDNSGNFPVRMTARGVTNPAGVWSTTVTYHGAGNLAADKVRYSVDHEEFVRFNNQLPLRNNNVSTAVELAPDI